MDTFTALRYRVLFVWLESFSLVFGGIYRFDLCAQGLVYLGIFIGLVITVPLYLTVGKTRHYPAIQQADV